MFLAARDDDQFRKSVTLKILWFETADPVTQAARFRDEQIRGEAVSTATGVNSPGSGSLQVLTKSGRVAGYWISSTSSVTLARTSTAPG